VEDQRDWPGGKTATPMKKIAQNTDAKKVSVDVY